MGTKTGIAVGVLDVMKGFVPAIIFTVYFGPAAGDVAGFAAVLGHITSPWLRGRGGKGVSTTLGAIMGTHPLWLLTVLPVFLLGFLGFRRIGMASVMAAITLIVTAIVWGDGWVNVAFGVALGLLVLFRHRRNIVAFIKKPLA
jgi:glycerol-3-phosphate acyltransferase PlsY